MTEINKINEENLWIIKYLLVKNDFFCGEKFNITKNLKVLSSIISHKTKNLLVSRAKEVEMSKNIDLKNKFIKIDNMADKGIKL
jgi:hypothetical protein